MQAENPLNSLHCLSAASLQAVGFLAVMSFRIIRDRNRERIFLLFLATLNSNFLYLVTIFMV
jgi:hypothetical protein